MDLDRLSLEQMCQLSKLIELMGKPIHPENIQSCIDILDAALTIYRRHMLQVREANEQHG